MGLAYRQDICGRGRSWFAHLFVYVYYRGRVGLRFNFSGSPITQSISYALPTS